MTNTYDLPEEYFLPTPLWKDLQVLRPKVTDREATMAALALYSWTLRFSQGGPGIWADAALGPRTTRPDPTQFSPAVAWWAGDMLALMFSDQTAVVAQRRGDDLIALPQIFKLRPECYSIKAPRFVPVIRSQRTSKAAFSFRRFKSETRLEIHEADEPGLRSIPYATQALDDLDADLALLTPLFDRLPEIHIPQGALPRPNHDDVWLRWMPQTWVSDKEIACLTSWCEDICDWVLSSRPGAYETASMRVSSRKPERINEAWVLNLPWAVSLKNNKGLTVGHTAQSLFADPERFRPPLRTCQLTSMDFTRTEFRQHRISEPDLASVERGDPVSHHRALKLQSRFGPLADRF